MTESGDPRTAAVVRDVLRQLLEEPAPPPERRYHLVIVPRDQIAECFEYIVADELVEKLRELLGNLESSSLLEAAQVFIFAGERWHISTGPFRHLLPAQAAPVPLYLPPGQPEPDPQGLLVPKPAVHEITAPPVPEGAPETTPESGSPSQPLALAAVSAA